MSAAVSDGVDYRAAELLRATDLSDGCGLAGATGTDAGTEPLVLAALDVGADSLAPPALGALEAGAEMTAAEDVDDEGALAVPVDDELHPMGSRPAAAANTSCVRVRERIIGSQ